MASSVTTKTSYIMHESMAERRASGNRLGSIATRPIRHHNLIPSYVRVGKRMRVSCGSSRPLKIGLKNTAKTLIFGME